MQTSDLVALVIDLQALMPTYINNHMGRAVQQFGLTLLNTFDPALAEAIHDAGGMKPFTTSGLMTNAGIFYGEVREGDCLWLRLTGLSAPVAAALIAYYKEVSAQLHEGHVPHIEIDRMMWAVRAVHLDAPHSAPPHARQWAGISSYQRLIERHTKAAPPRKLTLHFHAPTTFRSQGVNMPLPLPELVFGSLLSRWIAFTAHHLRDLPRDQLDQFIAHHVLLNEHHIQTDILRGKSGGSEIGFTGTVTYALSKSSPHLKKHDPALEALLQREYHWFARTLGMLADFARFSGIGRKTTTGMGAVVEINR